MTDYFVLLGQPRHAWLDIDGLKAAFHQRAATLHPDVAATGDAHAFAELNVAHSTLRDPVTRLRHLLELDHTESLVAPRQIPPSLADLFMRLADARTRLDAFLAREAAASSALTRALLHGEKSRLRDEWIALQTTLEAAVAAQLNRLQTLDANSSPSGDALAESHQHLTYLTRFAAQIREALLTL